MTQFDAMCRRVPICDAQRRFIESGRTGDPMTQALAWFVLQRKESPQGELIGTEVALK